MKNQYDYECWAMSFDDYCNAAVANVEEILRKKGLEFPVKFNTPMSSGYRPKLDVTAELEAEEFTWDPKTNWATQMGY